MKRALLVVLFSSCLDGTGNRLVSFSAQASAAQDIGAVTGQPLHFVTPRGFDVTLTSAKLFVGALYFSARAPVTASGATEEPCVFPALATGEVRGGREIDLLDPTPQPFPAAGQGSDLPTRSAALWLTNGDVNATNDPTVVLHVEGTATKAGTSFPFTGSLTIGSNRLTPPRNAALPSSNPICELRVVDNIGFETTLGEGSTVWLEIDVRAFFASVNFATLEDLGTMPPSYRFRDDATTADQADNALFNGLRANAGPYRFTTTP